MLINPNLSTVSEINKGNIKIYNSSLDFSFIDRNTIKIKKKKDVEFGLTFMELFNEFQQGSKVVFSGKFELIKGHDVRLRFNGFYSDAILISNIGVKRIEVIGKKNRSNNQAQVRIYHDDEVIFRFTEMKLENDEVTPYIPNENTLETAKRQYFIGGGTSRKYILSHRNIEQSSFRKEVAVWGLNLI